MARRERPPPISAPSPWGWAGPLHRAAGRAGHRPLHRRGARHPGRRSLHAGRHRVGHREDRAVRRRDGRPPQGGLLGAVRLLPVRTRGPDGRGAVRGAGGGPTGLPVVGEGAALYPAVFGGDGRTSRAVAAGASPSWRSRACPGAGPAPAARAALPAQARREGARAAQAGDRREQVALRPMTVADLPVVPGWSGRCSPRTLDRGEFRGELADRPRTRHYVVAEDGGRIVGWAGLAAAGGAGRRADHRGTRRPQGGGIGAALLTELLARGRPPRLRRGVPGGPRRQRRRARRSTSGSGSSRSASAGATTSRPARTRS